MGENVEDELHAGGQEAEAEETYHKKTDAGAEARRAVMDGAIVASVLAGALKGAFALYFGFRQVFLVLPTHLLAFSRFPSYIPSFP